MKTLLLTGFEPFGGDMINPSWEAARLLPEVIGPWRLHRLRLPVVYGQAASLAIAEAERLRAEAVVSLGLAGNRQAVTPEMVAINLRYAAIPDNAGAAPRDAAIAPEGPAAYFSTLPVRAMAEAIRAAGLPGAVSYTAGAYVCNDVMYSLLHRFSRTPVRTGFIHVPPLSALPLPDTVRAVEAALAVLG